MKIMENLVKGDDSKSVSKQYTNSKYGARSPKVSDSQSMMTG